MTTIDLVPGEITTSNTPADLAHPTSVTHFLETVQRFLS